MSVRFGFGSAADALKQDFSRDGEDHHRGDDPEAMDTVACYACSTLDMFNCMISVLIYLCPE